MPYKHRPPASEREMNLTRYEGHQSICQFLRDIYHAAQKQPPDVETIKDKSRVGVNMAKAMHRQIKRLKGLPLSKEDYSVEEYDSTESDS